MEDDILFLVNEINEQLNKPVNKGKIFSRKYSIYNLKFENMCLTVDIDKILITRSTYPSQTNSFNVENICRYKIAIKTFDYSCVTNFINIGGCTNLYTNDFETLDDAVRLLFSLKKNFKYSRLTDNLEKTEKLDYIEKKVIILNKLCDDDIIENCCICFEPNILLTSKCRHCVCRLCFVKIEYIDDDEEEDDIYKPCPICRGKI